MGRAQFIGSLAIVGVLALAVGGTIVGGWGGGWIGLGVGLLVLYHGAD